MTTKDCPVCGKKRLKFDSINQQYVCVKISKRERKPGCGYVLKLTLDK